MGSRQSTDAGTRFVRRSQIGTFLRALSPMRFHLLPLDT